MHDVYKYKVSEILKKKEIFLSLFFQINGEEEQRRFDEGKTRYLQNKAKRLAAKEGHQWRAAASSMLKHPQQQYISHLQQLQHKGNIISPSPALYL